VNPHRVTFAFLLLAFTPHLSLGSPDSPMRMTPLLMRVHDAPVPFTGSDRRIHLAYEVWITNFSSGDVVLDKIDVLGDTAILQTLDASAISTHLQSVGTRESSGTMAKSSQSLLFLHVILAEGAPLPQKITHRVSGTFSAAPPAYRHLVETGADTVPDRRKVAVIAPPLRGSRFVSADSCCDATRHTRAALPIDGNVWLAQRYAVDWEQLDEQNRIYSGPSDQPASYKIFGAPVYAVADAKVILAIDGLAEQIPGKFPENISLDAADGNSVILEIAEHQYALYAHLKTGSVKVHQGDAVTSGQRIALVGNTGNSVAPHLHFQMMDQPSSLQSNGLPYELEQFHVTGKTPGTSAFDEAESKGTPLAISPTSSTLAARRAFPLDQLIISFN
jgi:Peptidase family M23